MTWSPGGSGKGWGVGGSQGGPHTWPMGRETPPAPSWAPSPRERWRTARRGSGRRWTAGSLGGTGAVSSRGGRGGRRRAAGAWSPAQCSRTAGAGAGSSRPPRRGGPGQPRKPRRPGPAAQRRWPRGSAGRPAGARSHAAGRRHRRSAAQPAGPGPS